MLILNMDLHGENLSPKRMSCIKFIQGLSKMNDANDFSSELLTDIYYAIKNEAITWADKTKKEPEMKVKSSSSSKFR